MQPHLMGTPSLKKSHLWFKAAPLVKAAITTDKTWGIFHCFCLLIGTFSSLTQISSILNNVTERRSSLVFILSA